MSLEKIRQGLQGRGPLSLTLPVFNRLMRINEGFAEVLDFIQDAVENDAREHEIKTAEGVIRINRWVDSIEFSIDFLNGDQLAAEYDSKYLKIYGINLPQTAITSCVGKNIKDVIDLPRIMSDFSDYKIIALWNGQKSITIEINVGRMKMDSQTTNLVLHQIERQNKESQINNDTIKGRTTIS